MFQRENLHNVQAVLMVRPEEIKPIQDIFGQATGREPSIHPWTATGINEALIKTGYDANPEDIKLFIIDAPIARTKKDLSEIDKLDQQLNALKHPVDTNNVRNEETNIKRSQILDELNMVVIPKGERKSELLSIGKQWSDFCKKQHVPFPPILIFLPTNMHFMSELKHLDRETFQIEFESEIDKQVLIPDSIGCCIGMFPDKKMLLQESNYLVSAWQEGRRDWK